MQVQAVRPGRTSVAWLTKAIRDIQRTSPLAPVTVIVPNHYVGLWLRRELAQVGYANVRFEILARLAERLAAPRLSKRGLSPLAPVAADALIRLAVERHADRFGEVAEHPALTDALRDLFAKLRELDVDEAVRRAWRKQSRMADAALASFEEYERLIGEHAFYDDRIGLEEAALCCSEAPAQLARELGALISYLPQRSSPSAQRLVRALGEVVPLRVILSAPGDELAFGESTDIARGLDIAPPSDSSRVVPAVDFIVAPDSAEEARHVARSVLADVEAGVSLNRIAILWSHADPYRSLVAETLDAAGIAHSALEGGSLRDSVIARALLALLALPDTDYSRLAVLEWRSMLPRDRDIPSFAEWNRLTRDANIVHGAAEWAERLGRLATELRMAAEAPDVSEGMRAYRSREAATAEKIAALVTDLANELQPPTEGGWSAFVEWTLRLRRKFVFPHADEEERDAERLLDEVVEGLRGSATFDGHAELVMYRHALEAALDGRRRPHGQIGVGVVIGHIHKARGMSFDRLYVVGANEGAFPSRLAPDAIFPDGDPLDEHRQRLIEERSAFAIALASADGGRVRVSMSAWDSDLRPMYPAPWTLELVRDALGRDVTAEELRRSLVSSLVDRVRSADEALHRAPAEIDVAERRARETRRLALSGALSRSGLAARELPLRRALEVTAARASAELTAFDGNVAAAASASSRLSRGLAATAISASAVETWSTCPYRYYLQRVLYVDATEQPEDDDNWTVDPAARGTLVHAILERFLRSLRETGRPLPDERYTRSDHELLERIADEEFARIEARGETGFALAWQNERRRILRDLHTFLAKDEDQRSGGWMPMHFEQRFGFGGDSWPAVEVDAGGSRIRLRGLIDRIDTRGREARVIDYKTGRVEEREMREDPLVAGTQIQAALYAAAYLAHAGADAASTQILGAYWLVSSRYRFKFIELPYDATVRTRLNEVLAAAHEGVLSGRFPQVPGEETSRQAQIGWENCFYCDYERVCAADRGEQALRKNVEAGTPAVERT